MRPSGHSALILVVLALGLAACGGSSGGSSKSGSGSTAEYTKVTNDAAREFAAAQEQVSSASGGQADTTAAWTALAGRFDRLAARLKATKAPTTESQAPLAALTRDVTKYGDDLRAVASAGGVRSAAAKLVDALDRDGEAFQADLQKLPLY